MCIVTLSVVKKCQHELATIDLCRRACNNIPEDTNLAAVVSGEELLPRMTCTPSLGWSIFETLNVCTLPENDRQRADREAGTGDLRVVQGVVGKE
jgi:hypothetical protein